MAPTILMVKSAAIGQRTRPSDRDVLTQLLASLLDVVP